jgi:hypothetical protein
LQWKIEGGFQSLGIADVGLGLETRAVEDLQYQSRILVLNTETLEPALVRGEFDELATGSVEKEGFGAGVDVHGIQVGTLPYLGKPRGAAWFMAIPRTRCLEP